MSDFQVISKARRQGNQEIPNNQAMGEQIKQKKKKSPDEVLSVVESTIVQ